MNHKLRASIDNAFWKFITKGRSHRDVVDFKDHDKDDFLKKLEKNVNTYNHHFQQPTYYYYPKPSGILRPIKDFSLEDFCIYYYTVKEIQDDLVNEVQKIKNAFGGFRITEPLKTPNITLKFDPEYEKFNKFGYRQNWNNYQKMAYNLYKSNYQYYIHIDIAHFYNDINLDILEKEVRGVVHNKAHIIDLLFHFLKNSDKKDLGYFLSNVGLPQEDVGEMSRLLANFYLSPVDKFLDKDLPKIMQKRCKYYDFIRFADDIWIAVDAKDEADLTSLIQKISLKLQSRKLHMNENKLMRLSRKNFYDYWQFKTWDDIETKKANIPHLISLTEKLYKQKKGRWFTPFNYATQIISVKGNVRYFNKNSAEKYFSKTVLHPQLSTKVTDKNIVFYKDLINTFPTIRTHIENYLKGPRNIFPSVEHNLIILLNFDIPTNASLLLDVLVSTKDWYTKCLILKGLANEIKNKGFKLSKINQSKLLDAIKGMDLENSIERRYVIYTLFHLFPSELDNSIILSDNDQAFINYLLSM